MAPNAPKPTTAEVIGGTYNVAPNTLQDGQVDSLQLDVNGNLKVAVSGGGGGGGNVNLTGINSVPPALTNPLPVELSDGAQAVGTVGNPLSVNVISGGTGGGNVNITGVNSNPPSLTNPFPVELSDGAQAIGTFSNPLNTFDLVNGVTGNEASAFIVPIGGHKGSAYAPVLIDPNGNLQVVVEQPASNPIPVSIKDALSAGGNIATQDATPGTQFIFQEILMELRAMRKVLMLVYEESGEGDLSGDFIDDVNTPTNFDYN